MTTVLNEQLIDQVLTQVALIPRGKVATYGQLAKRIGRPRHARQVGRILGTAPQAVHYPCHRVVTATGRLVPGWAEQARLLAAEGVSLRDPTHVALKAHQWRG